MLEPIADELWIADGPTVSFFGFPYPTRMAVVRLSDGSLWVWSPVALSDALRAELEGLGPVRHLTTPNKIHHLFLTQWVEAWPEARLYAPPGLAGRRRDLSFHAELDAEPRAEWKRDLEHVVVRGSFAMQEVLFFHPRSRTCLVGDLVQRHDPAAFSPWRRALMRMDGLLGPEGSTPREWRASFVRRGAAREALRTALAWQPERLVIAHGACAHQDGAAVLRSALAWLRP